MFCILRFEKTFREECERRHARQANERPFQNSFGHSRQGACH
jgi:hypothetical protein